MSNQFVHDNFAIDYHVDKLFSSRFEEFVQKLITNCKKCQKVKDPALRREKAIQILYTKKETYKIKKKKQVAERKKKLKIVKKKSIEGQKKPLQLRLLKKSLLKSYELKKSADRKKRNGETMRRSSNSSKSG